MARRDIELAFVGGFWWAARERGGQEQAWAAASKLGDPSLMEDHSLRRVYGVILDRFAAGKALDDADALSAMRGPGTQADLVLMLELGEMACMDLHLLRHAEQIVHTAKAREQVSVLETQLEAARRAVYATDGAASRVATDVSTKLLSLFSDSEALGTARSWGEHLDADLAEMSRTDDPGITLPWPKLQDACGPWVPGELIGVSAYSGGGKSTFAANLTAGFARRGVPVIAFPTEMRRQWITRMLSAEANIPHRLAEKRQWSRLSPAEHARYRETVAAARSWPVAVVDRGTITPAEIVAASRVLRQRWPGRTAVVLIDHAHRLDYGSEKPEEAVGRAAKLWKNFAGDDRDGGLIVVALFQPRKPESGTPGPTHRPVAGYQIRGDSAVWNELDVHLSPFRAWVETSEHSQTAWGSPAARMDPAKFGPKLGKPDADGCKLDDEHLYVKVDKDRVSGEGPTVWLNFDYPSGRVYERHAGLTIQAA